MSTDAPTPPPAVKQVTPFEADLLRILRFFFGQLPDEEAIPLVRASQPRPDCLSREAVDLVRDTLKKGCVLYLVNAGGWKNERFLRNGEVVAGRLWERSKIEDLALEFSRHSLEFLIWLTASKPGASRPTRKVPATELTAADRLLLFLAYESLRDQADLAAALRLSPSFANHALCRLAFPGDFAPEPVDESLSFAGWFTGPGALVLEAMQPVLEARWLEIERGKGQIGDWETMRSQGEMELRVLEIFLDDADLANRWDLTRFLLGVLARVLSTPDMTLAFWTGGLQGNGPVRLAERLDAQRSALSLLQRARRFRQWEQRARTSGFMDEDYAACKFWLSEWERLDGQRSISRAEQIVKMLEPLRNE
jgi:hypothetical protein